MLCQSKKAVGIIKRHKEIEFAYIFGSSAKGAREPQDVDIAIFLSNDLDAKKRLSLQISLMDELEKPFGRRVDIVFLKDASVFIRHQVIKHGVLIFERRKGLNNQFRFNTMTEYFDAVVLQDFFYSALKRRWSHG